MPNTRDKKVSAYTLEALEQERRKAEINLEKATRDFDLYSQKKLHDKSRLSDLKSAEAAATKEWEDVFNTILAYKPKSISETGLKLSIIADMIDEGYENPLIMESLRALAEDLKTTETAFDLLTLDKFSGKLRVLIIDDDVIDRISIKRALLAHNDNLDFIELGNGENAIETIKSKRPTITLLDLSMPSPDGFEILELIRKDPELEGHPVWVISGSSNPSDRTRAQSVGANAYYVKPSINENYDSLARIISHGFS